MVQYLIRVSDFFEKPIEVVDKEHSLYINEFFCDSIQGEGVSIGMPATFLRLSQCTLNCAWCDTDWKIGRYYSYDSLFSLMESYDLITKFRSGQHLILTGGSPLKQKDKLIVFFVAFRIRYGFLPFIEFENECTLIPNGLIQYTNIWNNSPKLSNSGMKRSVRYKPEVIKHTASLTNSWFKFVIECEDDYEEVLMDFINPGLIKKEQVILMPLAKDLQELHKNCKLVMKLATIHSVRFCTRLQLIIKVP